MKLLELIFPTWTCTIQSLLCAVVCEKNPARMPFCIFCHLTWITNASESSSNTKTTIDKSQMNRGQLMMVYKSYSIIWFSTLLESEPLRSPNQDWIWRCLVAQCQSATTLSCSFLKCSQCCLYQRVVFFLRQRAWDNSFMIICFKC